jgi:putative ABC transport system permease protein
MARRFFPGGAVGRRFSYATRQHEVIGVVNDIRDLALDDATQATFYLSTSQNRLWPMMRLIVRTAGPPSALAAAARAAVAAVDPEVPIEDVTTMDDLVYRSTDDERYRTMLMCVFATLAVLLAGVGLYSTLARRVVDRRREIGVRLALGARPDQVRRLFLVEGFRLAVAGTIGGIPAALGFGRWAASLLFGVEPADPATLVCVTLAIGAVAVLATYLPAARASRLDPLAVLRE